MQYSQKIDVDVGFGTQTTLQYNKTLCQGSPDLSILPCVTYGEYSPKSGSNGVMDKLLPSPDVPILSEDFWNAGVTFNAGMQNSADYVRVWRPFISVSPYYNGKEETFNYAFTLGTGGELLGEDHLSFVVDYSESTAGTSDETTRVYFQYKRYF